MIDKIEVGDKVNVFFICADAIFRGEVLYTPAATGDCWRIKTTEEKLISGFHVGEKVVTKKIEHIHYVQIFERMDKLED